jgi:hypothetical protein
VPAPDLFKLDLPANDPPEQQPAAAQQSGDVVPFPNAAPPEPVDAQPGRAVALAVRLKPALERTAAGWRAAWVGDGVLGMRPRPVADLARQFWTAPPSYIRDALILRIPYAVYGVPVVAVSAVAHLFLLVISYPSLLAGSGLLVLFVSLFL